MCKLIDWNNYVGLPVDLNVEYASRIWSYNPIIDQAILEGISSDRSFCSIQIYRNGYMLQRAVNVSIDYLDKPTNFNKDSKELFEMYLNYKEQNLKQALSQSKKNNTLDNSFYICEYKK